MDNPIYIGDGVYAKFEHGELMLWTDRQENGRNWLVLGPRELESLLQWLSQQNATSDRLKAQQVAEWEQSVKDNPPKRVF